MRDNHRKALLMTCLFACVALPANAADRMRPGQWVGEWTGGGRTRATSTCVTQADADAMNGDAKSVQAYLDKTIPPSICKATNLKVSASQIAYTAVCTGGKDNATITTYHGDRFESTDSHGAKSDAKWVGPCK
jgi:Protein of unknown function (DUF3617)